jgi:hypothetical protein
MIVKKDSPIYKIPKEVSPKEILLLEGIRYSANMALVSYGRLRTLLHELSIEERPFDYWYCALNDAWGVIDSANRFYKLTNKLIPNLELPIKIEYNNFKKLRDSFHHLEERIEEKQTKEHFPLFGVLTWTYFNPDVSENDAKIIVFAPGIQQGEKEFQISKPFGKDFRIPIDHIYLTASERALKSSPVKVEIVNIIASIESSVKKIEEILNQGYLVLKNKDEIFPTDAIMKMNIDLRQS